MTTSLFASIMTTLQRTIKSTLQLHMELCADERSQQTMSVAK